MNRPKQRKKNTHTQETGRGKGRQMCLCVVLNQRCLRSCSNSSPSLTRFGASGEDSQGVARSNLGEFVRYRVYGGRVVVGKGRRRERGWLGEA